MRSLIAVAFATTLVTSAVIAQETPTEREAARDVLKKMGDLETSLDVPGLVAKLTGPNAARDAVTVRAKELMEKELLALGDDITKNPEIGFVEKRSVAKLTDYLKAHGFEVTIGTPGLETAFVAKYKGNNGPPNLGVIVEYDALGTPPPGRSGSRPRWPWPSTSRRRNRREAWWSSARRARK